jgi:hypothetical protein
MFEGLQLTKKVAHMVEEMLSCAQYERAPERIGIMILEYRRISRAS